MADHSGLSEHGLDGPHQAIQAHCQASACKTGGTAGGTSGSASASKTRDGLSGSRTCWRCRAKTRFVSAEPLLGPINFRPNLDQLDWIITGCERAGGRSGNGPMDIDWVRDIRNQCDAAKKAFFFKQYYEGTKVIYDGVLDRVVRQEWPTSKAKLQEVNP